MKHNKLLDPLAFRISQILHPVPVSIVTALIAVYFGEGLLGRPLYWIGLAVATVLAPITVYYGYGIRKTGFRERELRDKIYLRGIILSIAFTLFVFLNDGPEFVKTLSAGVSLSGMAFALLNEKMKISVHAGALSGASAILAMVEPVFGAAGFMMVPAVSWSRYRLDRHTPVQLALGTLIPVAVFGLAFWLGSS